MEFPQIKSLLLSQNGEYDLSGIITSTRITIIRDDGIVIFDNRRDSESMDNHANREEVIALQTQSRAESTRFSDTFGSQTYYYAEKLEQGDVLRLSFTIDSVYSIVIQSIPFMILIAICVILLSAFVSNYLTNKIIAPLYDIDEPVYDELDQFYSRIKEQERFIEKQKAKLAQKTVEFNILTDNIDNGLVLLNSRTEIIAINKAAKNVFQINNADFLRKNALELNHSSEFIAAIENTYKGVTSELLLQLYGRDFVFSFSPVVREKYGQKRVKGAIIIIVDNTEKAQAEKVRREFSANVSHELKTPLTSILGYAELIKIGMAKPEDIQRFSEKIHTEANSLLVLIDDIIKISQLDELKHNFDKENVDIEELVKGIISRLEMIAEKKNVTIHSNIEPVSIYGVHSIIDEMFYNIMENAIKYNNDDGSVSVSVKSKHDVIEVIIKDTGIGIPSESIERVFERFYRVDKSHSSAIKGTGLGLAIVKHAIQLHKGTIDVLSDEGTGTEMIITLPINA